MITRPCYVTRQRLANAMDIGVAAGASAELDRACENGSAAVDSLCRRTFYPQTDTRSFDRSEPGETPAFWRLWLDADALITLTSATSGGASLDVADLMLGPAGGPPYDYLEVDLATAAAWEIGSTWQRAVALTGLFGDRDDRETVGALTEALDASETDVDVDAATAAAVGVGDVLVCGTERMLVTSWGWADTTVDVTLTASRAAETITGVTIADFADGELLLAGGERMRVIDRAGTSLTVQRGVDGTTLAEHTTADLYAARTLRVARGASGSTAAAHDTAATLQRQLYPPLVQQLAEAEAIVSWQQRRGAYSRPQGSGESSRPAPSGTLDDLRRRTRAEHGRFLIGAV